MHQSPTTLLHPPLHTVHAELGARFTGFAGWSMPLRYGSETAEHRAVRERAGLFDLSHMGQLEVSGPHAAAALDHALVGHLSAVPVGGARYTMLCDETGGVLDDLVAYRLAADRYLLVTNAVNTRTALAALHLRCAGHAATVADHTAERAIIAVQGPRAADTVRAVVGAEPTRLRYYTATAVDVGGRPAIVARTGYTGEDGFEFFLRAADAEDVWRALLAAGAGHGLTPAGLACRDTLRIEAGMPLYGCELHQGVTPFEAGLGRVVSFTKPGDFVGRAALAERRDAGAATVLVGLTGTGRRVPRTGHPVVALADGVPARPVGVVTSGALSPALDRPVAMAHVHADAIEARSRLGVVVRGTTEPVRTTPLPFYRRPR
ncbi:glycine cleavage system aminomethyltransferase GcvT [Micromonospora sp. DT178]|uniref:glycine cleavage system aminomethyltransferase GcvT n=1 Tax=Micromonospora sp. DT178 TaxID=3393436 RepID=UPI003CEDEF54